MVSTILEESRTHQEIISVTDTPTHAPLGAIINANKSIEFQSTAEIFHYFIYIT